MQWAYGITTVWHDVNGREHQHRFNELLPRTLESLRAGGFTQPTLFVDGCPFKKALEYEAKFGVPVEVHNSNIQTHGNWFLAMHELYIRNYKAERFAVFQDDLICYKNLKEYLTWSPYPKRGYLNLYTFPQNHSFCPKHNKSGGRVIGWHQASQRGWGAVGLVFSNEACRALLSSHHMVERVHSPDGYKGVDGGIVEALRSGPIKFSEYCHNPSLVQHTGILSSICNSGMSTSNVFNGEDFDAKELITQYNSHVVPVPPRSYQIQ
jgi:hypothetical protein